MKTEKKTIKNKPKKLFLKAHVETHYEKDFYKWTREQSALLKKGDFTHLDTKNLREELESLGNSEYSKLESHITILMLHLLKIKYQPSKHSKSWDLSIKNATYHATRTLARNPGLKSKLKEITIDAYFTARIEAAQEIGLDENTFPEKCPWKIADLLRK